MAFWGAPLPCDDSAYMACCAAMEMAKQSDVFFKKVQGRYGQQISYGIGIHIGPAVVGNIGTMERMDYTAIGDTVNTASRLESYARPGKIYISRAVADKLGDRAKTISISEKVKLSGKQDDFEILTLEDLKMDKN
jgi:adenylate cyclase